jgi:hypothetical protein
MLLELRENQEATNLMSNNKLLVIPAILIISGCMSQIVSLRQYTKNWIGHPINELKKTVARPDINDAYKQAIGWKETTYKLDNGNWVYVEVDSKNCFIHWEVNPEGIIVGSHTEGKGCRWR